MGIKRMIEIPSGAYCRSNDIRCPCFGLDGVECDHCGRFGVSLDSNNDGEVIKCRECKSGQNEAMAASTCSVSNSAAQDINLSLRAKGLYLLIKSCIESPGFDCGHYKPELEAKCKEGSKAFDSAWRELKQAGYLKQYRIAHGGESKGFHYDYELLDTADDTTPPLVTRGRTE